MFSTERNRSCRTEKPDLKALNPKCVGSGYYLRQPRLLPNIRGSIPPSKLSIQIHRLYRLFYLLTARVELEYVVDM